MVHQECYDGSSSEFLEVATFIKIKERPCIITQTHANNFDKYLTKFPEKK